MEKIAVIGSGIAGLGAAFLLKDKFSVTVYEKNPSFGGHARTISVTSELKIDTGFIVFNQKTYPNLMGLFHLLDVPITKSDMSFGVSLNQGSLEYGSKKLTSLFAQRRNLFRVSFWRMLSDILRFNHQSKKSLTTQHLSEELTMRQYLRELELGGEFEQHYLIPMAAAIWSTPPCDIYDFPALSFLRFFHHHGLLDIHQPIQWYTIKGGSIVYVEKILNALRASNTSFRGAARSVERQQEGIMITDHQGQEDQYDKVILATHSDQALSLLNSPTHEEQEILGAIPYQKNIAILHKDDQFMAKRKSAWSSWMYLSNQIAPEKNISLSYWMNSLQPLATEDNYFVTLNPTQRPREALIVDECVFEHPLLNNTAIAAQKKLELIQGYLGTYYCGAYWGYGFHEDGLVSAVNVARQLGVSPPW